MTTQAEKATAFRALHQGEPFVIPNPWDAGSAKLLASLGYKALATTSGGFAFTIGRHDGDVTLDDVAAHVRALAAATDIPVSVDLEHGYGPEPEDAAEAIRRAAEAGAVGGSIEDYDPDTGLYEKERAAERVAAAAEAARALDVDFVFTARADNHFRKNPDLDDTIARLQAYEQAGADVLYAPRLEREEVGAVCAAVSKPANALAMPGMSARELVDAGAQRVSLGANLMWIAVVAAAAAAEQILETGDVPPLTTRPDVRKWLG